VQRSRLTGHTTGLRGARGFPTRNLLARISGACALLVVSAPIALAQRVTIPEAWGSRSGDSEVLAFTHVSVVDVAAGKLLEDHTVVVRGDSIVTVAPALLVLVPQGASVVDATDRFLIPGLWDMHAHPDDPEVWEFLDPAPEQRDLLIPQFPLWGVTGIRDMGGSWNVIRDWRERIAEGELLGPRIVAAGPLIDGPEPMWPGSVPIADAQAARHAVDSLLAEEVDFLKVYSLVPRDTLFREMAEEYEADRAWDVFRRLAHLGTFVTPTLLVSRRSAWFDPGQADVESQLAYMPEYIRRWWTPEVNVHLRDQTPESSRDMQILYATLSRITAQMHAAGIRLLVGTDTGGDPHLFPGFTVHEEMEELVAAAGLSPADALRAATLNPAAYFGLSDQLGTIDEGKRADLVLIDGNPLDNIRNTRRIAGVMVGGRWIDTADRVNLLEKIRRRARSGE